MYQGNQPILGRFSRADDISSQFNSATSSFQLTVGGSAVYPGSAQNIIVCLNGVIQEPGVAYTIAGSNIIFSSNIATGVHFFGIILGNVLSVGTPSDGSIDSTKLASLNSLDFITLTSASNVAGRLRWNDNDGTLDIGLKGGNVILQVGQEQVQRIFNNTGSPLLNGKIVYVTGAQGFRVTVAVASNANESTSYSTFGMMTETVANGAEGYVTVSGLVRDLDTSAFAEGAQLWLGTSGNVTATKPVAPAHTVFIGIVIRSHAINGSIFVNPSNGHRLDELHDVAVSSKVNKDVLQYDSVSQLWKNVQKGLGGYSTLSQWYARDVASVAVDKGTVSSGTVTFDYTAGSSQRVQVGGALTLAFSNWAASGNLGVMHLELVNAGSAAVTFPTINWIKKDGTFTTSIATYLSDAGKTALQSSGTDFAVVWSKNGGTTMYGKLL